MSWWTLIQADAGRLPLPDKSVDLVVGSPPYLAARWYGDKAKHARGLHEWVEWMLDITREAVRVSRGLVIWACAGSTKDWCYQPGPEGLLWRWVSEGHGIAWRPVIWYRVGIPGSGGTQWYRADTEYCLAFTDVRGELPYGDPKINGHRPKWDTGGRMSNRTPNGVRVNEGATGGRLSKLGAAAQPDIANPGTLVRTNVGGGLLGHKLAHESEAPYPVGVPAFFIRSHCPPGGLVLDPFVGSGTTLHAALDENRRGIGIDMRDGKGGLDTARRRLKQLTPRGLLV